jgi:regulator of sirC expression with transglutaminase-like and TPR domain
VVSGHADDGRVPEAVVERARHRHIVAYGSEAVTPPPAAPAADRAHHPSPGAGGGERSARRQPAIMGRAQSIDRQPMGGRRAVTPELTDRFAAAVRGPEAGIHLAEASLLVAAHAQPGLDVGAGLARLDELAAGCPAPTLDGLVSYLFGELGFRGDAPARYGDPRNSFLDQVLERRRGIPITLSVVTMEVGRRVGVPFAGIGLPGHFLVRHEGAPPALLDPFGAGRELTIEDCAELVRSIYGDAMEFTPALLAPVGPRAILARMLANLRQVYLARHEVANLEWVVRLRTLIPGVDPAELAQVAGAQAALGRFEDAAATMDDLAGQLDGEEAERAALQASRHRARLN